MEQQEKKIYNTYEEAKEEQTSCLTCGKPKRSLVGHYYGSPAKNYYTLDRCKQRNCSVHCQRRGACRN